jgi:hypothetical protein
MCADVENLGKASCNALRISVTVISAEMIASRQRYRLLASLVGFALALLYPLVATEKAWADGPNPLADPALNSALQAADDVTGAGPIPLPSGEQASEAPATVDEPVTAGTTQQASTEQAADAAAAATQEQPKNVVISIRINSPGNDGPISQTNVAGSAAGASNDSSTGQEGVPGGQQAAMNQAAAGTATATQEQPENIIIVIRINSPGDNGAIEQTNTTVAVSNAGNVSVIRQGGGSGNGGAAGGTATGASPDPQAPIGPPAQQGGLPRMSVALLAPTAPKTAFATGHRIDRPAPPAERPTGHRPAGDRAGSAPSSRQTVSSEPSNLPATVRSGAGEPQARVEPAQRSAAARANRAASGDPGVGRRVVDALGGLAPPSPLQTSGGEKDVTNAVVFTLIAVLGAFLVFFGSTFGLRLFDPRRWRHG